jgi:hypothetical protein
MTGWIRPTQSLVSLRNFGTPAFHSGEFAGPRFEYACAVRLLSDIKGAMAVHSARFAAVISPGLERSDGIDADDVPVPGAAEIEGRTRSIMPTTSAAVAITIAAPMAMAETLLVLRRGGSGGYGQFAPGGAVGGVGGVPGRNGSCRGPTCPPGSP